MKIQFNHNTNNDTPTTTTESQPHDDAACLRTAADLKLPEYIADLLDDDAAFAVEQHLADCDYCRKKYLLVLRVQRETLKNNAANNGAGALSNESLEDVEVGNHGD